MKGKYLMCMVLITVLYGGCVKKTDVNEKPVAERSKLAEESNLPISKQPFPAELEDSSSTTGLVDEKPYIQLYRYNESQKTGIIRQEELDIAGLWEPDTLREIAERVRNDERENVSELSRLVGQNGISSLDGIELFPNLVSIGISNSRINRIIGYPDGNPYLRYIYINSDVLEDISDIVMYENLITLSITSKSIKNFPDLSSMENLRRLRLRGASGINFNELKLPPKMKIVELESCNIASLDEVSNLFNKCTRLYLVNNQIEEIDLDMDFGTLRFLNLSRCPVAGGYDTGEYDFTKTRENIKIKNTVIDFFPVMDDLMTLQSLMILDEE